MLCHIRWHPKQLHQILSSHFEFGCMNGDISLLLLSLSRDLFTLSWVFAESLSSWFRSKFTLFPQFVALTSGCFFLKLYQEYENFSNWNVSDPDMWFLKHSGNAFKVDLWSIGQLCPWQCYRDLFWIFYLISQVDHFF